MKATVYLRVARTSRGFKYAATGKPNDASLLDAHGYALPTIAFGLVLDLPVGAFQIPVVAEVTVPEDRIHPGVVVEVVP